MFVILIASFLLAILFALSVNGQNRDYRRRHLKRRKNASVETTPVKTREGRDEAVQTPESCEIVIKEGPDKQSLDHENLCNTTCDQEAKEGNRLKKRIYVTNGFCEETRVLVFRSNKAR